MRYTIILITRILVLLTVSVTATVQAQLCETETMQASTPDSQFTDNADGTVMDIKTGLVWKKCSEGAVWNSTTNGCDGSMSLHTWRQALDYVTAYNNQFSENWRLPNIKELSSIIELRCKEPAINLSVFPSVDPDGAYWSNSPAKRHEHSVGAVYFIYGAATLAPKETYHNIRLVRDSQVIPPVSNPFTVQAADEVGTAFTVPEGKTQCTFNATGTWQRDPDPIYLTGPNGDGYACGCLVPVPAGYVYGLVATSNEGDGFNIGNSAQITVSGGDILHFLMNDGVGAFANNSGALSVSWSCQ